MLSRDDFKNLTRAELVKQIEAYENRRCDLYDELAVLAIHPSGVNSPPEVAKRRTEIQAELARTKVLVGRGNAVLGAKEYRKQTQPQPVKKVG